MHTVSHLPISDVRLTDRDMSLEIVIEFVNQGWPSVKDIVPTPCRPYWCVRDELYVPEGLLLRGERVVVPVLMRAAMLKQIHRSHLELRSVRRGLNIYSSGPG